MVSQYNENYNGTMPFSDTCYQANLAAGVPQTYTIPGSPGPQYQAYFKYAANSNVYVCKNGTASAPGGGAHTTQPYNEFKPEKRFVTGGDVLSFVTPDPTAFIGVSLRQL